MMEIKTETSNGETEDNSPPDDTQAPNSSDKDNMEEEELPPAEIVTVYYEDEEPIAENTEYITGDPLAWDVNDGAHLSMTIKDEPLYENDNAQAVTVECEVDDMIVKTETVVEGFESFVTEPNSFWKNVDSVDLNWDSSVPKVVSCETVAGDEQVPPPFSVEGSSFEDPSKSYLEVNEEPASTEKCTSVRTSVRLQKKLDQYGIVRKSREFCHPTTIVKQERFHNNMIPNKSRNQMLNPYMVQMPLIGYKDYRRGAVSGPTACEFCGKLFSCITSLWGHLSSCPNRRRYRSKKSAFLRSSTVTARKTIQSAAIERKAYQLSDHTVSSSKVNSQVKLMNISPKKRKGAKYQCGICAQTFHTQGGLYKHSRKHPNANEFTCGSCEMGFKYHQSLLRHCARKGHDLGEACTPTVNSGLRLKQRETSPKLNYCCSACDETFDSVLMLRRHQKRCKLANDEDKRNKCSICGTSFKSVKRLLHHMNWHSKTKSNICPVCKKKFMKRGLLVKHKLVHRKEGKYCCEFCDKVFDKPKNMSRHRLRHRIARDDVTCHFCFKTFETRASKSGHLAKCSMRKANINMFTATNKVKANSKMNLLKQIQRNVKLLVKNDGGKNKCEVIHSSELSQNENRCHLCKKFYTSARGLARHLITHLGQRESESSPQCRVICDICGSKFSSKLTLVRHQKFHKVGNHFRCLICKKDFVAARNLKIHMHSHKMQDNGTLHKCDQCNKTFSSDIHLKYHRRTHAGIGGYTCPRCHRTFASKEARAGHGNFCPGRFSAVCQKSSANKKITPDDSFKSNTLKSSTSYQLVKNYKANAATKVIPPQKSAVGHPCEVCHKKFSSLLLLKYHSRQHTDTSSLSCKNCKRTFANHLSLNGHHPHCPVRKVVMAGLLNSHDDKLKCHICGKITSTMGNYVSHMRTHSNMGEYTCSVCGKVCPTKTSLGLHIARFHKEHSCKTCSVNFNNESELAVHLTNCKVSSNHQPKKVNNVARRVESSDRNENELLLRNSQRNTNSSFLPKHGQIVRNKSMTNSFREETYILENFDVLESDPEKAERWRCKICRKELTSKSNLKCHLYIHSGDSPYKCEKCGRKTASEVALKRHYVNMHGIPFSKVKQKIFHEKSTELVAKDESDVPSNDDASSTKSANKMFQCEVCSRVCTTMSQLNMHMQSHARVLKCSVCDGSYRTLKEFRVHICADNFVQLCEHCGLQFTDKMSFTSHVCIESASDMLP